MYTFVESSGGEALSDNLHNNVFIPTLNPFIRFTAAIAASEVINLTNLQ